MKLFIILGNQLFSPQYLKKYKDHTFFMAEDYDLCTYEKHHKLKILLFLSSMRSFRDEINQSKKEHHKSVFRFRDYYTLSELKDLMFHVQEHRFTIPQIKDLLDEFEPFEFSFNLFWEE